MRTFQLRHLVAWGRFRIVVVSMIHRIRDGKLIDGDCMMLVGNDGMRGTSMSVTTNTAGASRGLIRGGVRLLLPLLAAVVVYGAQHFTTVSPVNPPAPVLADCRVGGGSLVIAGGGYVTPEIRSRFVELAGGSQARIVVIPAVDPAPGEEGKWLAPWQKLGVQNVQLLNAHDRTTASTPAFSEALRQATGVWMSGGDQELLAARYVGTPVQQCLHDVLHRNGVVGGCSAGAAILSRVMIKEGELEPVEASGFDLLPNVVIDQHFLQRNRLWRLQKMLEAHPDLTGFGIDENTALEVELQTGRLKVLGESYALVCIPSPSSHSQRIEILKSGDDVLLSKLRTDHLVYQAPAPTAAPAKSAIALAHVPSA